MFLLRVSRGLAQVEVENLDKGKLKPLVNDPVIYHPFVEHVEGLLKMVHKQMERAEDSTQVFRLQGEARILNRLLLLREEVNGTK